ncbi:MAG: YHYH protein, partial [Opitutaceae bacterium]
VYGPFGYAEPRNPGSGIRRMTSGYVRRDGTRGTTNLAATGRTTLPAWAARAQNRGAALPAALHGPAVGAAFPLGRYLEDHDYLGDLGKTQGIDFDLNECNARFCVTPEFPQGTYAYFLTIEEDGTPRFPNLVGRWFFGSPTGGAVNAINEPVTEHIRASQASPIAVSATKAGGAVLLEWSSVEGATYRVETSADGRNWTPLAAGITSRGGDTTPYATATVAAQYRVTLTALATYDTRADGGLSGVGNAAVAAAAVGTTGTARLVNIATRAALGGAAGTPIAGFVLGGSGTKPVLVRAVGPGLASYGVTDALADPRLSLVSGGAVLAGNDNWQAGDAAAIAGAGAFALAPGSRDAALVTTLGGGAFSAPVSAADGGRGVTLLEVYDLSASPGGLKVVNASTRAFVGTGESVLIPGFVVGGSGSLRVLLRAIGPALADFGVGDALVDPQITLYRGSTALATNDNWSSAADASVVATVAGAVGAFPLPAGGRDAALLATLAPGAYSAVVSGVGNATGTVLIELYVVD